MAVRSFWSDLEKFPKSASGEILGGWVNILRWGAFWGEKWVRKNVFCEGMIVWWGFKGIHPAQMNSMVPGTHMGRLFCPKPTFFNYFVGISSFPGKLQVAPASPAYFPLWGSAAWAKALQINSKTLHTLKA